MELSLDYVSKNTSRVWWHTNVVLKETSLFLSPPAPTFTNDVLIASKANAKGRRRKMAGGRIGEQNICFASRKANLPSHYQ